MRDVRQGLATADRGERKAKAEDTYQGSIDERPARGRHLWRRHEQGCDRRRLARQADHAPRRRQRENSNADPHASRDRVGAKIEAETRADPQKPEERHGEHRGQVLWPDVARQTPSCDRGHGHPGCVVSDDYRCERRQQQTFDQPRRGGNFDASRAKGVADAPDEAARNEDRPTLDVDGAHERRQRDGRHHEPGRGLTKRRPRDASDEKRRNAELGNGQRSGLPVPR